MTNSPDNRSRLKRSVLALAKMESRLEVLERERAEPIAIIGIGCRFPGAADSPDAYWTLLRNGVDATTEIPPGRWDIDAYYSPDADTPGTMCTRRGGFLRDADQFDAEFFDISRREAVSLDPQQRLLLEVSWEALEHGGLPPEKVAGTTTGVFIGVSSIDYAKRLMSREPADLDVYMATGSLHSVASGRISYVLGLQGPSVSVDTACSSSLVAAHLACQSLRSRDCDMALAGGANMILSPEIGVNFTKAGFLSPDGRCKAFGAAADGYGRGEGCGVVVLKRLSDALADGDSIVALIRGSAINQDGRSSSLTAPNGPSQQTVIRGALRNAGVKPTEVSYVEAHGTGTELGDPIEMGALAAVYGAARSRPRRLVVGSSKTNIGHMEGAAGIGGLIKTALALHHAEIPPHLHFNEPSPHIPWPELPVVIPTERMPWPAWAERRIAGVSSFGFSGTNVHMILEAPSPAEPVPAARERPCQVLTLSAKTKEALRQLAASYVEHLDAHPDLAAADLCFTTNTARTHFRHRLGVGASSTAELRERLAAFQAGEEALRTSGRTGPPKVVFLFAGQSSQYVGLGRELYETEPTFRGTLKQCDELLRPYLAGSLLEVLYPEPGAPSPLDEAAYARPAIFALESSLAELWRRWGIVPQCVMGQGVGEYAAACVAGVFSLEDGLKLAVEQPLRSVSFSRPKLRFVSSLTGELADSDVADPDYWLGRASETPRLEEAAAALREEGCDVFVEVGPEPSPLRDPGGVWLPSLRPGRSDWQQMLEGLAGLYKEGASVDWAAFHDGYSPRRVSLPTYPFQRQSYWYESSDGRRRGEKPERLLRELQETGEFSDDEIACIMRGFEALARRGEPDAGALSESLYELRWQAMPRQERLADGWPPEPGTWLIFTDGGGTGAALVESLVARGQRCIRVVPGEAFQRVADDEWRVDPRNATGFEKLLREVAGLGAPPLLEVVHLWSLDAPADDEMTVTSLQQAQRCGLASVLHLVQALVRADVSTPARLWVVTRGAMPVEQGATALALAQAPVWGLGEVVALEHPDRWGGMIDLPSCPTGHDAEALLAEFRNSEGEDHLAFRHGERYVARVVRSVLPGADVRREPLVRADGTYLITGGLGSLGCRFARWLVARGAKHLVLTGRRGAASPAAREAVAQLEAAGATVLVVKADVAEEQAVGGLFAQVRESMPPLRGVIHAAGVSGYDALLDTDLGQLESVCRAKLLGTWVLHQLTLEMDLDFFILCSSVASVWGATGHGHYAAANRFLDAVAHYRRGRGRPALSVNWGPWAGGGMATEEFLALWEQMGVSTLPPAEALEALARLVATDRAQAVVANVDWTLFRDLYEARRPRSLVAEIEAERKPCVEERAAQRTEVAERLLRASATDRKELLVAYVQQKVLEVLGSEIEQSIDPQQGFFDMGMESLMAVELRNRLASELGISLPATLAFKYPTMEDLVEYLAVDLWPAERVEEQAAAPSALDHLSEDQLEASIADELQKLDRLARPH